MRWHHCFLGLLGAACFWGALAAPTNAVTGPFELREPQRRIYELEPVVVAPQSAEPVKWLRARQSGSTNTVEFGSRIVLKLVSTNDLSGLLAGSSLQLARVVSSNVFVLEAGDARLALREAHRIAARPGVLVCHPVRRRAVSLHAHGAPAPDDPMYPQQWHLENRDWSTGAPLGEDLNLREAWNTTRGAGLVIAVCDDGMEVTHPDLAANANGAPHHNFITGSGDGSHMGTGSMHGTAVAGLAAAVGNNQVGVSGVAPAAGLASWVIFDENGNFATEEQTAEMFQYSSNVVAVQNHSWGNATVQQFPLSTLDDVSIQNAVTSGRGGLGVVMVRAAGNERTSDAFGDQMMGDANDDGYANDPRQIAVAAVRASGRTTSYSSPGACVLVAGLSEDSVQLPDGTTTNYPSLVTTDREGSLGYNPGPDNPDYCFGDTGFSGTSGSTPQIAGVCALMLAANPTLTYRDVQQALLFASRQRDPADPFVHTNGAGLRVSHDAGFGVPDAGLAVRLAQAWSNRPAATTVTYTTNLNLDIPDDGLRVIVTGTNVPPAIQSIPAFPCDALQPDDPIGPLPITDVGQALSSLPQDLQGRGALIERGVNYFVEKLAYAAAAGARFGVVWNNTGGDQRIYMSLPDPQNAPLPAVFISQNSGLALQSYLQQATNPLVTLQLNTAKVAFLVTNALSCEHVSLRVTTTHPSRADLRITLVSPAGTRSVLHHFNSDTNSPLDDWTFYSVQHFFEPSAGRWQVEVGDESPGNTGAVTGLTLSITGVPIKDTDHDGLDDDWEMARFGSLKYGAADDPDHDGWTNAQEQVLGWDPMSFNPAPKVDFSNWNDQLARLSWPASTSFQYEVATSTEVGGPFLVLTNLPGRFPELEWFLPNPGTRTEFYRVRALAP